MRGQSFTYVETTVLAAIAQLGKDTGEPVMEYCLESKVEKVDGSPMTKEDHWAANGMIDEYGYDYFNQILKIGDEVAFMCPNYRWMIDGKVIKFTPKTMVIEYNADQNYGRTRMKTFRASYNQVIKKPKTK